MIEVTLHLKIHIKTNALFQTDSQTTENNKGHLSDVIIRQVYRGAYKVIVISTFTRIVMQ
ncbi:MAG TPA: hypothetical protein DCY62_12575 [Thalassospira sp.]|uniref:Uncharacterized protein n=1 Tax=Thalassospira povalilytica TaxID=732237 RepID=A0ABX4RAY3_9PROT|nr:hypothetical protein CU041_07140 [Thalassospira povalilytica]HAY49793.1 hypothetical protein [Thalassospira sp.]